MKKIIPFCMLMFMMSSCLDVKIFMIEKGKKDTVIDSYGKFHFGPSPGDCSPCYWEKDCDYECEK